MTTYRLQPIEGNCTFQKITTGRKWVGRVGTMGDGTGFYGKIGKTFVVQPTAIQAFDEVVARHLGYISAAALRSHNAHVRHENRERNQAAQYAVQQFYAGNSDPFLDLLKKI